MLKSNTESHEMWVAAVSSVLSTGPVTCIYQGRIVNRTKSIDVMFNHIQAKKL